MRITDEVHADFRHEFETALSTLCEAYPRVPMGEVRVVDVPGDKSLGFCDGNDIVLNGHWFCRPRAVFDAAVVAGRASQPPGVPKWHGGIGGLEREPERLITHEFGHLLGPTIPGYTEFARAGHAAAMTSPSLAVSGYALVAGEPDEWFAETFAAMRLGGSGSPQVAELMKFLGAV